MYYIFDNTGECLYASTMALSVEDTQVQIEDDNIYNTWEIELQGDTIVKKPIDTSTEETIDYSTRLYRLAHGEFIPQPYNSNYNATVLAVNISGDNFNSPNIGLDVEKPLYPFYNGIDYAAGISDSGQVYISNGAADVDKRITGWLTVQVEGRLQS